MLHNNNIITLRLSNVLLTILIPCDIDVDTQDCLCKSPCKDNCEVMTIIVSTDGMYTQYTRTEK